MAFANRPTVLRARQLRREMSLPEVLLWRELRKSELKFRRQHPIKTYILDFYCASAKLAVEVDGISHEMGKQAEADRVRDEFLAGKGIKVLRLDAKDVLKDPIAVAEQIVSQCE